MRRVSSLWYHRAIMRCPPVAGASLIALVGLAFLLWFDLNPDRSSPVVHADAGLAADAVGGAREGTAFPGERQALDSQPGQVEGAPPARQDPSEIEDSRKAERVGRVTGLVTWSDGRPIQGAELEWVGSPVRAVRGRTSSGPDGTYAFASLPLDTWLRVRCRVPGCLPMVGEPLRLSTSGQERLQDFFVDEVPGLLEVRVLQANGQPVPRASVGLTWGEVAAEGGPNRILEGSRWVQANPEGITRLAAVKAGVYRVHVTAPGSRPWRADGTVLPGEITRLDARLERGHVLRLRILDAEGRVLPGLALRYEQPNAEGVSTTIGAEGRFEAQGLADLPGVLDVWGILERDGVERSIAVSWSELAPSPQEQVLCLPAPAHLRGRFSPPPREDERFSYALHERGDRVGRPVRGSLAVERDGVFSLDLFPSRGPQALVLTRGKGEESPTVFPDLDLAPDDKVDLGIIGPGLGYAVEGSVRTGSCDVRGEVRVTVRGLAGAEAVTRTDERGIFPFESLFAGPLSVRVDADGRVAPQEHAFASARELEHAVFELASLARVWGRVRSLGGDLSGAPDLCLENLSRSGDERTRSLRREGKFDLWLPAGAYRAWFRSFGALEWIRGPRFDLGPGEERELDLILP